jgi:Asp-tRNA(Asn)/Glu-tRNA(Gln) amidotransferase A subunit family amidase
MDKVGPMCRTARGCAIVFKEIIGEDPLDPTTVDAAFDYDETNGVSNLKIAWIEDLFLNDSARYNVNNQIVLDQLRDSGMEFESIKLPEASPFPVYDIILRAEAGAFFDDLVLSGQVDEMVEQHKGSRANSLRQSRFIPAVEYLQANRHRKILLEQVHDLFRNYDVILTPTFGGNQLQITNLTGHPAISIPTGLDEAGRPTSITFLGNLFGESEILEFASWYQRKYPLEMIPPAYRN